MSETRSLIKYILVCLALLCLINGTCASPGNPYSTPEPSLYLNFNEGGANYAVDGSGNGNMGILYSVSANGKWRLREICIF